MGHRLHVLAALLVATGCSAVLGIEDAELDPTFDEGAADARTDASSSGSSGSGGLGAGGSSASGGDAATGGRSLCDEYCDEVIANCSEFEQYTDREICLTICSTLPEGEEGAMAGNSVQCRLQSARVAARIEPDVQCPIAGPGGNRQCGDNCEGYCSQMMVICPREFASNSACLEACKDVPDAPAGSDGEPGPQYTTAIQDGDSIQCRLYHVSAATLAPLIHCEHAAGVRPCAD